MSDPLYAKDLLRLAAAATGAGRLQEFDVEGSAHNPTCGDRVSVTIKVDERGRIIELAHETSACVLTQASASILGARLAGSDKRGVETLRGEVASMLRKVGLRVRVVRRFGDYKLLPGRVGFIGKKSEK